MRHDRAELPFVTAATVAVALLVHFLPGGFALAVFDRDATAAGEWWRLASGGLAHFSTRHLLGDVAIVAVGGWLVERRGRRAALLLICAAMLAGTLATVFFTPSLRWYGGLSSVGYALVVFLAVRGLAASGRSARLLASLALGVVGARLALSGLGPGLLAGTHAGGPIVVATASHLAGAAVGIVGGLLRDRKPAGAPLIRCIRQSA